MDNRDLPEKMKEKKVRRKYRKSRKKATSEKRAEGGKKVGVGILDLPGEVLKKIASLLDEGSCLNFHEAIGRSGKVEDGEFALKLDKLPAEVLTGIARFLSRGDLGRLAQVNKRMNSIADADLLWSKAAKNCLVTNGLSTQMLDRTGPYPVFSPKEKVRISRNWIEGFYQEIKLTVQDIRYMPRIQLERTSLWVSWGNKIWSHPRNKDGTVKQATTRSLKGHTDDVSKFVVRDGYLISGGRDRTLVGWNSDTGEFLFAKRYCHGSEVSAVDVIRNSGLVVTGSRDRTVKIWSLDPFSGYYDSSGGSADERSPYERGRTFPKVLETLQLRDRVWSLAAEPVGNKIVIGTAGLMGIPSLHLVDLESLHGTENGSMHLIEMGSELKKGAGMLDVQWQTPNTFLSCGYDACTRLWDVRVGGCVRKWEDPFDEAIYCFATDGSMSLVCGTARHGLVRLWDMRMNDPVQIFYSKHPFGGYSSPVYSVAFDQRNLYVALDQCVNLISFSGYQSKNKIIA